MCSQALLTVVHGVVLQEHTMRQPAQVLGSQDVWVSGPMIVSGNNYHQEGLHSVMRDFENVRLR